MKTVKKITGLLGFILMGMGLYAQTNTTLSTVVSGTAGTGGSENVHIGYQAAAYAATNTGKDNVFTGYQAGFKNSGSSVQGEDGSFNVFNGAHAGYSNETGYRNVSVGYNAGYHGTASIENTFLGFTAGFWGVGSNNSYNTFIGTRAGHELIDGKWNTSLGNRSGYNLKNGSSNVFIGNFAGGNGTAVDTLSNRLYIANSDTNSPLIYGEFDNKKLIFNGKVGIDKNSTVTFPAALGAVDISAYNLFVKGGILTDEIRVRATWADYVFDKEYKLKPLKEVEAFIAENGHLPNIPSKKQVKEEGVDLGNMVKLQQEKIEELTLYLIQQNKEMKAMKARLEKLERN